MAVMDDKNIVDSKEDEQVLKGIQPRRQKCYFVYKAARLGGILFVIIAVLAFIATFIPATYGFTQNKYFRFGTLIVALLGAFAVLVAIIDKKLFLRKAPFDDWVFEIAEKRLGTNVIFYDAKRIYIQYDRSGKEVDKKEFVTEMSDKSIHYSYFYTKTDIDQGYIVVECKQRAPIPNRASFSPNDDKFWNIIPMGLTINPNTQKVSPIGWYLNDQNMNDELYTTVPSTSILICGGTGCYDENTPILMHNTLVQ